MVKQNSGKEEKGGRSTLQSPPNPVGVVTGSGVVGSGTPALGYRPIMRLFHIPEVQKEHGDIYEQVTEPDVSPSLYQIVMTGTVGSMPGNSNAYEYPDLGSDDQAHDHPDYEKLNKLDPIHKAAYVEEWLTKDENYEIKKKEREEAFEAADQVEKAKPEGTEG